MNIRTLALLGALALSSSALGCKEEPTRWDTAATSTVARSADAPPVKEAGSFNKFFPADGVEGMKRVYTQEKTGFAEAKLQKDGKDVAVLSISDASGDAEALKKFEGATDKIQGYPLVTVGKNQSSLLVKGRYQVKVSSQQLDADARKVWFEKFNLSGLSSL
ncbi:MAG: hypothetical protein ACMG6S_26635 [Byssovorax sp.]